MNRLPYEEARKTITAICRAASEGAYDSRAKFMAMLDENPHIAAQGYNPYGKIFYWNNASTRLYGYGEADAVNQDIFDLILPPDLRNLARDMVSCAAKTGKLPEPSACDLMQYGGDSITVFSGHLVFKWENNCPEFYCLDLPLETPRYDDSSSDRPMADGSMA